MNNEMSDNFEINRYDKFIANAAREYINYLNSLDIVNSTNEELILLGSRFKKLNDMIEAEKNNLNPQDI